MSVSVPVGMTWTVTSFGKKISSQRLKRKQAILKNLDFVNL